jgi:hypothetical protein
MSWQPPGIQPDGWQPDGWQPVEQEDTYPDVAASRSIRLPAGGVWCVDPDVLDWCEIIWADFLPEGTTLVSVAYSLPAQLTLQAVAIDLAEGKSALLVSGVTHGSMSHIAAVATLSDASTVPFAAPLRGFNG